MGWMGWTFANGIVGYLDSSNASHGAILITTSSGEKVGHYDYVGSRALMELSGSSTSLLCQWEGATRVYAIKSYTNFANSDETWPKSKSEARRRLTK